jgi:hypothetical protein
MACVVPMPLVSLFAWNELERRVRSPILTPIALSLSWRRFVHSAASSACAAPCLQICGGNGINVDLLEQVCTHTAQHHGHLIAEN